MYAGGAGNAVRLLSLSLLDGSGECLPLLSFPSTSGNKLTKFH